MGLSSSQARLLNLTSRMHQIEYKAAKIEAEKLQMANKSKQVYQEYQNALEATKIQYKTINSDASATFVDATYNDLCFGNAGDRFALLSTDNGKPYIPQDVADKYDAHQNSASAFATAMTGYVPSVIPSYSSPNSEYVPTNRGTQYEPGQNISNLQMGQNASTTIKGGNNAITLSLNQSFGTDTNCNYSISSEEDQNVTFEYLENGRLVICGNGLTITSNDNKNDDIILLGNDNTLDTGGGNDIVRVGYCVDQSQYCGSSTGNTINTGAGTDHVIVGKEGNSVNSSESVLCMNNNIKGHTDGDSSNKFSVYSQGANADATSQTADSIEGISSQGASDDCRIFSLINSLGKNTNNKNLSNYVTISGSASSGYNVTFNNYTGENRTAQINASEVQNTTRVTGDLTTILIDLALNKLMAQNKDDPRLQANSNNDNAVSRADYNTIAKYFFGNEKMEYTRYIDSPDSETGSPGFITMWQKYKNGTYTNLSIGFKSSDPSLGIVNEHAYSVKNVVDNKYVEVVNPWNDADTLKISWSTFTAQFEGAWVFGTGKETNIIQNAESRLTKDNIIQTNNGPGSSGNDTEWYYFYNLHQQITAAGGYETVPQQMTGNKEYLRNLLVHGFAYLTVLDKDTKEFVDTSVATNTSLQEVDDEKELRKAEAKYEADMRRIDYKDRKFDYDLAALDAERNAVKQEMETLKTVAKDNVDRTFKLFS